MTNINIFIHITIHIFVHLYVRSILSHVYSWDLAMPFTWPSAHHLGHPKSSSLLYTSSSTAVPTAGGPLNGPVYTGIFTSLLLHTAQGISHKPTPSTLPSTKQAQVNYSDNPSSLILYLHNYNIQYNTNTQADLIQNNYVSTYTKVHHIHTAIHLQQEILNFKYWMNLQVEVKIPSVFAVLFDEEALCIYNKIFSMITKVCPCTIYYMYSVLYRMTYTCLLHYVMYELQLYMYNTSCIHRCY